MTVELRNKYVISVTKIKMSAKVVVQKIDSSNNFKYLVITIEDDNESAAAIFSEWLDGKTLKKHESGKSSHLIVKMVSGQESSSFNLDSCSKEVDKSQNHFEQAYPTGASQQHPINDENNIDASFNHFLKLKTNAYRSDNSNHMEMNPMSLLNRDYLENTLHNTYQVKNTNHENSSNSTDQYSFINPLEYSLERVKENNARIMENIHMLNRTLNYTKKKEILDIVCPKPVRSYPCNTCGKCFVYETGLKRHYSTRHSIMDTQPRWQVVWTCIECFQVWPRHDLAFQHASQCYQGVASMDCVREIKTSSLLKCEFCEKVFTSIPRLLRHTKTHSTASNYECHVCEMVFQSYKIAEQHWMQCPWLKTTYTFYLPKLLLCNACDRKFRNYEQLYNHRYKARHFSGKSHYNHNNINLGIIMYQCEVCGQTFPSIIHLQNHRSQYHSCYEPGMLPQYEGNYHSNYSMPINNEYSEEPENGAAQSNEL